MKTPKPLMKHLVMLWAKTGAISAFRDSVVTHLAEREDQELFYVVLVLSSPSPRFGQPLLMKIESHEWNSLMELRVRSGEKKRAWLTS